MVSIVSSAGRLIVTVAFKVDPAILLKVVRHASDKALKS